jgi:membrane-associated phospholipid phosphatase
MRSFELQLLLFFNRPLLNPILVFLILDSIFLFTLLLLLRLRAKRKFVQLTLNLSVGIPFVFILKYVVRRPRPYLVYPDLINPLWLKATPSFPSLHTFLAFLSIWFMPRSSRWKALMLAYLISIPFISLHAGVHWPSDVIASAALGWALPLLFTQTLSNKLVQRIRKRFRGPRHIRVWLRISR